MIKKEILKEWTETAEQLLELISPAHEKELNAIPFPESWTAAQVAEHLLKSYGIVEILKSPQTKAERSPDEKVEQLKGFF
jgi:hypothetical protein